MKGWADLQDFGEGTGGGEDGRAYWSDWLLKSPIKKNSQVTS